MTAPLPRLAVPDGEIEYDVRGDGRPVVLAHAGAFDLHMWDAQADLLATDHRVVRWNTRGHGASSTPHHVFSPGDDLRRLLDHLGIASATVIGLSYGSRTAIELAVDHPDRVDALLLTAPGVPGITFTDPALADLRAAQAQALADMDPVAWVDAYIRMWVDGPYRAPHQVDATARRYCLDTALGTVQRHGGATSGPTEPDLLSRLHEITAPTLIVNGTLDSIDHHRHAGLIAAAIPGAQVADVDACHMVNLDAPERFNAVMRAFLAATARGERPTDAQLHAAAEQPPLRAPVAGGELAYDVRGDGPPVVLLHGGMLDRRMWDAEMALLARTHRVVRVDARGHGASSTPAHDFRRHDDLRALLDHLGIARATLVGLSLGARTAIDTALAHPDRVAGLLLASPGVSGMAFDDPDLAEARAMQAAALEAQDADGYVEGFLRQWVDGPRRAPGEVDAWLRARCRRMAMATLRRHATGTRRAVEVGAIDRLAEIRVPTQVVTGDLDARDIHAVARRIATEVPGATAATVGGAGHTLTLEQPHAWTRHLHAFVDARVAV